MGEQSASFISMRYGLVLIFLVAASLAGCERQDSTSVHSIRFTLNGSTPLFSLRALGEASFSGP